MLIISPEDFDEIVTNPVDKDGKDYVFSHREIENGIVISEISICAECFLKEKDEIKKSLTFRKSPADPIEYGMELLFHYQDAFQCDEFCHICGAYLVKEDDEPLDEWNDSGMSVRDFLPASAFKERW